LVGSCRGDSGHRRIGEARNISRNDEGQLCLPGNSGDHCVLKIFEWKRRRFPTEFSMEWKSYQLIVNVYIYAITN
jgi:hypothetical protein